MNTQFDNMIQVLTYFANQCDLFKPMLEGVESLQQENAYLKDELEKSLIVQNRMQLNTTFSADYANFGVVVASESVAADDSSEEEKPTATKSVEDDLYNLFKSVISIGKDNYDRKDMQYKLDFYSMVDRLDFDRYIELWDLIDSQHAEEDIETEVKKDPITDESLGGEEELVQPETKESTEETPSLLSRFKLKK